MTSTSSWLARQGESSVGERTPPAASRIAPSELKPPPADLPRAKKVNLGICACLAMSRGGKRLAVRCKKAVKDELTAGGAPRRPPRAPPQKPAHTAIPVGAATAGASRIPAAWVEMECPRGRAQHFADQAKCGAAAAALQSAGTCRRASPPTSTLDCCISL